MRMRRKPSGGGGEVRSAIRMRIRARAELSDACMAADERPHLWIGRTRLTVSDPARAHDHTVGPA